MVDVLVSLITWIALFLAGSFPIFFASAIAFSKPAMISLYRFSSNSGVSVFFVICLSFRWVSGGEDTLTEGNSPPELY